MLFFSHLLQVTPQNEFVKVFAKRLKLRTTPPSLRDTSSFGGGMKGKERRAVLQIYNPLSLCTTMSDDVIMLLEKV
jgi:hypothetical protein